MGDPLDNSVPGSACASRVRACAQVSVHRLRPGDREAVRAHLRALDAQDRYLRFGYPASDAHIDRYVNALDFRRDELYAVTGAYCRLVAVAHLAYLVDATRGLCVEFGVSVVRNHRGRGLGSCLFRKAALHARNEGARFMMIHALSENAAMLQIARRAGAQLVREGGESEAWLELPAATLATTLADRWAEWRSRLRRVCCHGLALS
ncbi:MAG: hypothetical protein Fur0019_02810 [Tibeticola sp.]